MTQTKKKSALEAATNVISGLLISFIIQVIIYPVLNIPVTYTEMGLITIIFFVASFVRSYVIRRIFTKL